MKDNNQDFVFQLSREELDLMVNNVNLTFEEDIELDELSLQIK